MSKKTMMPIVIGLLILSVVMPLWADPIAVLKSDAPFKDKAEACRLLSISGGADAVPVLETMLTDEKLSHMARYGLEPMPWPEAGAALRNALGKTTGHLQVGVISSLGVRKDTAAVPALSALLSGSDELVAQTAANALARIVPGEAGKLLLDALGKPGLSDGTISVFCNALFESAEALDKAGKSGQAIAIYDGVREIYPLRSQLRAAALRGAVHARSVEQGIPLLVDAVDEAIFLAALRTARELGEDTKITAALAAALPALPPAHKIKLIQVLAYRKDAAAGPAVLKEVDAEAVDVRVAALRALAGLGYDPAVPTMVELAVSEDAALAEAAQHALSFFPGKAGDAALKKMLKNEDVKIRRVAIALIGNGGLGEPLDLLMQSAQNDADEGIRVAALKSLADHAGMDEMPALLDSLLSTKSAKEMQAAENTLKLICVRQKTAPVGDIHIQKALWGDVPDGVTKDVTQKVAEMVKAGSMSVDASNANFGDPTPGVRKGLKIDYTESGTAASKTVSEGQKLYLTSVSVPVVIVDTLCGALVKAQGETRMSVLRVLSSTGSAKALGTVKTASVQETGEFKEAALRTLCEWPSTDALPTVMELFTTSSDPTLKVLALRGAVRLLKQDKGASADPIALYATLMAKAGTADERILVLSGLAQVPGASALEMVLTQFADEAVKAEAVQAAITIAKKFGGAPREENLATLLSEGEGNMDYWRVEDGVVVGGGDQEIPQNEFLWSNVKVGDFYLSLDVKLAPNTANAGIQFRSQKADDGEAQGYQADVGEGFWGRLYHEQGRGKLVWNGTNEKAVKPGEWNHYEILAVGPAIWLSINGRIGVACFDAQGERSGLLALQIHSGDPQTVQYRINKLVHNPKIEMGDAKVGKLISKLSAPKEQ
jgi:HEAT repeat protein